MIEINGKEYEEWQIVPIIIKKEWLVEYHGNIKTIEITNQKGMSSSTGKYILNTGETIIYAKSYSDSQIIMELIKQGRSFINSNRT